MISDMRKLKGEYFRVQSSTVRHTHARNSHLSFNGDQPHVSLHRDREEQVEMLLEDLGRVVGDGGSGKTTLVRKAYQHVCSLFKYFIQIIVSQSYISVKEIRRNILH